jgi:hypothetical protein
MKTFKEFINERDYQPDYSDGRNVRPPAEPASPMGATHYSVYSDEADDREAKKWADRLVMELLSVKPASSAAAAALKIMLASMARSKVAILWQGIQTETNFNRIEERIFVHLQNHEDKNAAATVLSIIRPDQDVSGGDVPVLSQ